MDSETPHTICFEAPAHGTSSRGLLRSPIDASRVDALELLATGVTRHLPRWLNRDLCPERPSLSLVEREIDAVGLAVPDIYEHD